MQVLPGLISVSILMDTPGTMGKKWDPVFTFLSPVKKGAFRIDVCNINWVWEFYSFKNALGAQSLRDQGMALALMGKYF